MKWQRLVTVVLICCYFVIAVRDELMDAVLIADVRKVEELMSFDPNILSSRPPVLVNRKEAEFGRTSIMVCGLDPQSADYKEIDWSCVKIGRLLVQNGAITKSADRHGWDALSIAAVRGFTNYSAFLIANGNPLNRPDKQGRTAVMKALGHGHYDTFELLYKKGANTTLRDNQGLTAIHHATSLAIKNESYVDFLSKVLSVLPAGTIDEYKDKDLRTPLMYAAISNKRVVVETLLLYDSDPRMKDKYEVSAYSMSHDKEVYRLLQEKVVQLTERDHRKWFARTALKDELR